MPLPWDWCCFFIVSWRGRGTSLAMPFTTMWWCPREAWNEGILLILRVAQLNLLGVNHLPKGQSFFYRSRRDLLSRTGASWSFQKRGFCNVPVKLAPGGNVDSKVYLKLRLVKLLSKTICNSYSSAKVGLLLSERTCCGVTAKTTSRFPSGPELRTAGTRDTVEDLFVILASVPQRSAVSLYDSEGSWTPNLAIHAAPFSMAAARWAH